MLALILNQIPALRTENGLGRTSNKIFLSNPNLGDNFSFFMESTKKYHVASTFICAQGHQRYLVPIEKGGGGREYPQIVLKKKNDRYFHILYAF